jgi:hypothetical protein
MNNTGAIAAPSDVTLANFRAWLGTLDVLPKAAADMDFQANKLTNVGNGVNPQDAATFGQLNALIQGQTWKDPVRAATTANGALATAFANGQTIDGVVLATGDRILIKNQTTAADNGIYTVNAAGAPTRAADADVAAELNKATVIITSGTANQGDVYTQTSVVNTLGTDIQTWTKTGEGNVVYSADEITLHLAGQVFSIKAGGVGVNELAAAVAGTGLSGGAGSALSVNTGTGLTISGDNVVVDTTVVARVAAATVGDGAASAFAVTHNLGKTDILVEVFEISSGSTVECDVQRTSANAVTVSFTTPPTANQYRVVVHG